IVRPAFEDEGRAARRGEERGEHRLEDERRASGRTDREGVRARLRLSRPEDELARSDRGAFDLRLPDLGRCFHGGQMLALKPGILASRADRVDPEGRAGQEGEAERGAEDLPSALARRSVDFEHAYPFTQTT